MKGLVTIIALLTTMLSGCGMIDQQPSDDSRWIASYKIAQAKYRAREAKHRAREEMYRQISNIPTATLTTIDSGGEPVTASFNIAPLVLALASMLDNNDNHQDVPDVMPKGVIAEIIDSAAGFTGTVVNSPVGYLVAAGWMAGEVADRAGDHSVTQNGDMVGSNNKTKIIGDGTATGPAIEWDTVMEPAPLGAE